MTTRRIPSFSTHSQTLRFLVGMKTDGAARFLGVGGCGGFISGTMAVVEDGLDSTRAALVDAFR